MASILTKRSIKLTKIITEVNDKLKEKCQLNNFGFICNDNVSRNYLWKDGIHFDDKGTNILGGNFVLHRNQNNATTSRI